MGRDGGGYRARRGRPADAQSRQSPLAEAQALQQRAERKRGLDALPTYEQATAMYRQALSGHLAAEDLASAHFGLAETLQGAADALASGSRAAADGEVQAAEAAAGPAAVSMLREAVEHYDQVREADGSQRADALVNGGNALASWAEASSDSIEALQLLERAAQAYRSALEKEPDAATFSNLGDALVQAAELLVGRGDAMTARDTYGQAMQAYAQACERSSSDEGDDLPGLLHNWGVGLHSAGTHLQDPAALEQAAARLRAAADFGRADTAVLNALGDTLAAAAERALEPAAARQLLQRALDEGFLAALRVDRRQAEALVGLGEVQLMLGRGSAGEERQSHFRQSAAAFKQALERPSQLGGWSERCAVRFNAACAVCLAGDLQAAEALLRALLAAGGASAEDVLQDADFAALQGSQLFQELRASQAAQQTG